MQWHDQGDDQHSAGDSDRNEAERPDNGLTFGGSDERLPWLESDDERQDDTADTGRIIAFALVGLLVVVAVVGALWWFSRSRPDPALVADGSLIEAPDSPYKERPDTPGGRDVEGTGNTSFEVAEGRRSDARVAEEAAPARPVATASPTAAATAAASDSGSATAASGGVGVQIGAYSSRASAEAGWNQMANRFEALKGVNHRILEASADGGMIYRLQAVAGDRSSADALCRSLKSAGGDCQVKR